jgi:hypothetical protein
VIRRDLCASEAGSAIGRIEKGMEVFGLSKGRYSLVDILLCCLNATGPADVTISTWTAANSDLAFAGELLRDGRIRSLRFLTDFSFPSRQPAYCAGLVERFGADSLRVVKNHAKFCLVLNDDWHICIRSSMNLNLNKRLESFEISDDPGLAAFLLSVVDEIFRVQAPGVGVTRRPAEAISEFETLFESGRRPAGGKGDFVSTDEANLKRHFGDGPFDNDVRRGGLNYAR